MGARVGAQVAAQVAEVAQIVELFNDLLPLVEPPKRKLRGKTNTPETASLEPIDLEHEQRAAQPAIRARMALVVDLAKSEAWRLIGEREKGYALLEPHVWAKASSPDAVDPQALRHIH